MHLILENHPNTVFHLNNLCAWYAWLILHFLISQSYNIKQISKERNKEKRLKTNICQDKNKQNLKEKKLSKKKMPIKYTNRQKDKKEKEKIWTNKI